MKAQVISFRCTLRDRLGRVLGSTYNQDVVTAPGPPGSMLQHLADGLADLKCGERRSIALDAAHAYGFYDPALVLVVPPHEVIARGREARIGDRVEARGNDGRVRLFQVTKLESGAITLDANHPLAGQDLVFDIEATAVRDATSDDLVDADIGPEPTKRLLH